MTDVAITPVGVVTYQIPKKPCYLITLDAGKKTLEKFIAIEAPELLSGFVQTKGFFCNDKLEEDILKNINEILTATPKDLYVEMLFPQHRVTSIRNLIYRAK